MATTDRLVTAEELWQLPDDEQRHELTERDVLDGVDVVPGWALPVRDIFDQGLAD